MSTTTINSIGVAWVKYIGGESVIYNIFAFVFIFTILYVVYKITT